MAARVRRLPSGAGKARESLIGNANLADGDAYRAGARWSVINDWPTLRDGHAFHAPVDSFHPNKFGLYQMSGNVWEWCREGQASYKIEPREKDGYRAGEKKQYGTPPRRRFRRERAFLAQRLPQQAVRELVSSQYRDSCNARSDHAFQTFRCKRLRVFRAANPPMRAPARCETRTLTKPYS